jgi:saccharopine dehydrogenase (NAD+, L-lysine-forming)
VVIGGYGAVGRTVCTELADHVPVRVFAAGRNVKKAETFSQETGGRVWPLELDIANPSAAAKVLEGARVVVACVEPGDAAFAREVLERGIHYVDISASYAYLQQVERLDALARRWGATAVLSVGLSPGLTNLLARHCIDALGDELRSLDIFVLLGLGEAHGEAAVRWTIENLNKRFEVPGVIGAVCSLEEPKKTVFSGYGARTCYRFDFADQHVLARTLGVERVATRVCFDPAAATRLLALAKRTGVLCALRGPRERDVLVSLFTRFRMGSDGFAVKVEAEGMGGGTYSCSAWGRGEARATGVVAARVAERLLTSPSLERGVFHTEQLFEPTELFDQMEVLGITVNLQDGRLR